MLRPGGVPWCNSIIITIMLSCASYILAECTDSSCCKTTISGVEYSGNISQTDTGLTCQAWNTTSPHNHSYSLPDSAENFCRNPSGEYYGPWCYTVDPYVTWRYCEVPYCDGYSRPKLNCKDHYGQSYEGTVSQTRSGRTCQAWNTTYPHSHGYVLPLSAENFCRNPDDQPLGPWCYTVDQEERYGFCDVKNCAGTNSNFCKTAMSGSGYTGNMSQTESGLTCQTWKTYLPDSEYNFCRNPTWEVYGPWCYTSSFSSSWGYCDVPYCDGYGKQDCKNLNGYYYEGTVAKTQSGRTCQAWNTTYPNTHSLKLPISAENFCRNPGDDPLGPWCYTIDSEEPYGYCDVPKCSGTDPDHCKTTLLGTEYKGTLSHTTSGLICQAWNTQTPHTHSNTLPESEGNFCRNPDGSPYGPWCYTMHSGTYWEYCEVPYCNGSGKGSQCRTSLLGLEYEGTVSQTRSGLTCQAWNTTYPHYHAYRMSSSNENFCRNPDEAPSGPWCYPASGEPWEYCAVPYCKDHCKTTLLGLEYTGMLSQTWSEQACQAWNATTPHYHSNILPGSEGNYCRNPDDAPFGPWCYTTNSSVLREYCDVPYCDDTLMNSDNFPGTRYNVIHTESDTGQNPSGLKALFWRYTFVNSKSEAMLQVLQEGLDCEKETRRMIVYHQNSDMNGDHSKFTRCRMGNVIISLNTGKQMCEFYCSHSEKFQQVVLRLMEGATPVLITAMHLYPSIH